MNYQHNMQSNQQESSSNLVLALNTLLTSWVAKKFNLDMTMYGALYTILGVVINYFMNGTFLFNELTIYHYTGIAIACSVLYFLYTNAYYYHLLHKCKNLLYGYLFKQDTKFSKSITVTRLTENYDNNRLYDAVFWFLTNNKNDLLEETPLSYSTNQIVEFENENKKLANEIFNKTISHHKERTFVFSGHNIKYSMYTDIITAYAQEGERKINNETIQLQTLYDKEKKEDIFDNLIKHIMLEYAKSKEDQEWEQKIYLPKEGRWDGKPSNNKRNIKSLILKEGQKERLIRDITLFSESEDWYNERDIPYKRGYLLYGPPGTGKTSFIKAISLLTKRHIHYLMIKSIKSDAELTTLLKDIDYKNTVVVIEDIDCASEIMKSREEKKDTMNKGNENKKETNEVLADVIKTLTNKDKTDNRSETAVSELTPSGILNALDGVFSAHGRILIVTSNKPKILDPALLRAGRLDVKECLSHCNEYQIIHLYKQFFNTDPDLNKVKQIKAQNYSPATVTEVFLRCRDKPDESLNMLIAGNFEEKFDN